MELINWGMASMIFGMLVGYYVGERGWTGVKIDLNNVKTDIEVLKAKIDPPKVVVTATPTVVASAPTA